MSKPEAYLKIKQSPALSGEVSLFGAKNAVLVIMASLLLTRGTSRLKNVPASTDVGEMIKLLRSLGAIIEFDQKKRELVVNTASVDKWKVQPEIMQRMRASVLVMGPLLARFGKADIALPGGCVIGSRPIDLHLINFARMGVLVQAKEAYLMATVSRLQARDLILEYPSTGATENLLMAAVCATGATRIINAALEPEVIDLVAVLQKMGAHITVEAPATILIEGVMQLEPIEHELVVDRLEAGSLLAAAAITGGEIVLPNARPDHLDLFLFKLEEMGHTIVRGARVGIRLKATSHPKAVSCKTAPYPGFPTDLQAPMMALQSVAEGQSVIEETVFENRLVHAKELAKLGANISIEGNKALIKGVSSLRGGHVIASDIRASCALAIAGLVAQGSTIMTGIHHWQRGYDHLERKLASLGACIALKNEQKHLKEFSEFHDKKNLLAQNY